MLEFLNINNASIKRKILLAIVIFYGALAIGIRLGWNVSDHINYGTHIGEISISNPLGSLTAYFIFEIIFYGTLTLFLLFIFFQYILYYNNENKNKYLLYLAHLFISIAYFSRYGQFNWFEDNISYQIFEDGYSGEILFSAGLTIVYLLFCIYIFQISNIEKNIEKLKNILKYIIIVSVIAVVVSVIVWIKFTEESEGLEIIYKVICDSLLFYVLYLFFTSKPNKESQFAYLIVLGSAFLFIGVLLTGVLLLIRHYGFIMDELPKDIHFLGERLYFKVGILLETFCFAVALSYQSKMEITRTINANNELKLKSKETEHEAKIQMEKALNAKKELELEMAKAQNKIMKQRLNPHFMGNLFTSIQRKYQDDDTTFDRIAKLSTFIKEILNISDKQKVKFSEEINLCNDYMKIIERDDISFKFDEVDDFYSSIIEIPPLTILTIIENCIKHAFKGREEEKNAIIVSLKEEDTTSNAIVCKIEDNGNGIEEEILNDIRNGRFKSDNGSGKGLYLIKKQLNLFKIKLIINSSKQGTCVILKFKTIENE